MRPGRPADADLQLYRARWGDRARAYHREREAPRAARTAFSPERWETARESPPAARQDLLDARRDGRRYLRKHLLRPWRYNYGRVCRALVQAVHPAARRRSPPARIPFRTMRADS